MPSDTPTRHTAAEALAHFELIDGPGDRETKACVMTAISWMAGEAWTDSPTCAHRLLRQLVIPANDHPDTTPEDRARLVKAGETGLIDSWWVPDTVIAWLMSQTDPELDRIARLEALLVAVGEWRSAEAKSRPDLSDAVLSDAVLSGADLSGADLSGAVLSGAVLRDADLSDADLSGADLRGADLRDADLSDADLSDAVLSGAVLRGADLSDADLSGADLRDADLIVRGA